MPPRHDLPILGQDVRERSDAARNREALLSAAQELVDRCGVEAVTMDAVAASAGVGKGTVFRRFRSRAGLMAALLDQFEADWQAQVISGPPPLGPGAPPLERLLAFGRSRLEQNLRGAALIRAALDGAMTRNYAVYSFAATHLRYLLDELEVAGDIALLATDLMAPLEVVILQQQIEIEGMSVERIAAGWEDLALRIIARRRT
ncbi:TetR/AcrR family transcriptional regulator [Nocardioides pocheonensis]|uniref:TetR/AcrR family transcriptional regulator n=1 Tax=Nocardioides pocheonensis TaxID=661485 RepID=A0A3N0GUL7_9ACTN|nr:TetR/AcrR family transcriptional regulator [Nocardioides pocheonensis]RNM16164.1 TetR/AcrR family transcriptional regulator [Nocardioides pocheonensis]